MALLRSLVQVGQRMEPNLSLSTPGAGEADHSLTQVVELPWAQARTTGINFCHAERHRRMKTATAIPDLSSLIILSF